MNILEEIKRHKIKEVAEKKSLFPEKLLERSPYFEGPTMSMKEYLTRDGASGIIAEFKRKSPSKGNINLYANPEKVSIEYMQAGASAISVLTDEKFFGSKKDDLTTVRKFNYCPILRKDFIFDPYQIVEARSLGADVILLIAKLLKPHQAEEFTQVAHDLNLEVLLELHDEKEVQEFGHLNVDLVGINNRNLNNFEVNTEQSIRLAQLLPTEKIKIAESGIHSPKTLLNLRTQGFQGFLIGEYFMKNSRPGLACKDFVQQIKEFEKLMV